MVPQWAVRSLVRTLHLASDLQQLLVVLVQVVPVPRPVLLHEQSWPMAAASSCWHLWEQTRPGMGELGLQSYTSMCTRTLATAYAVQPLV